MSTFGGTKLHCSCKWDCLIRRTSRWPASNRPKSFCASQQGRRALVTRLTFERKRVTGVEIFWGGRTHRILAGCEVIMSLGAMNTPKVLMQSGIGDETQLRPFGIPVVEHVQLAETEFQVHAVIACVWECSES